MTRILLYLKYDLTSLRKKLRIDALESIFSDDSRRTFSLEATIYSLQFGLRESGRSAKACQRIWPVSRYLLFLVFRICDIKTERICINCSKGIDKFLLCTANPSNQLKSLTRLKNFAESLRRKPFYEDHME